MIPTDSQGVSGLPLLAPRRVDSHKGTYGRALLLGGSVGFAGAIGLAGMAALRSGAGLVRLAVPEPIVPIVAGYEPSYMTFPLPADSDGRLAVALHVVQKLAAEANCLAIGPGLSRSMHLDDLVMRIFLHLPTPAVFDADAINALVKNPGQLAAHIAPRILTPHPGEFARLSGVPATDPQGQARAAEQFARRANLVIVLKGHHTFVADPLESWTNVTGNPGMATGGSGDVLTGVITALVCQGLAPRDAARLGVYVHGLAGDLAAHDLSETALIASDLVRYLPAAFRRLEAAARAAAEAAPGAGTLSAPSGGAPT